METQQDSKAMGCVAVIIILGILSFIGWMITPDINKEDKVISSIQGGWHVQQKEGGFFTNVKIEIEDNNYRAWRYISQRESDDDNWGEPTCQGTLSLGDVQTYKNVSDEFRRINWSDCNIDLHDARYDKHQGLYWGEWAPFKKEHSIWSHIKWAMFFIAIITLFIYRKKIIPFFKNKLS